MPEPLEITVGPYTVEVDADGIPTVRKCGLIICRHDEDSRVIAALARELAEARQNTKAAFLQGYDAGYDQGGDDVSRFECGGGSKHVNVRARERETAWRDSDSYVAIAAQQPAREEA